MKTIISLISLVGAIVTMQSCRTPELMEDYENEIHQKNIESLMKTNPDSLNIKTEGGDSLSTEIIKDPPVKDRQDW